MAPRHRTHSSVADLLSCNTFLERLTPNERSDIFRAARCRSLPASPDRHSIAEHFSTESFNSRRPQQQAEPDIEQLSLSNNSGKAYAAELNPHATGMSVIPQDESPQSFYAEMEQLLHDKRLLHKQKRHLQAKVTTLQYQVSMLLADGKGREAQGDERIAALETVITRLQTTVADVGATAARVAGENKVLLTENMQLSAEREQYLAKMQELKEHCRQLEEKLVIGVAAATQQAVEAAAAAASPLNALLTPQVLAATVVPLKHDTGSCSSSVTQVNTGSALQEIAALKRSRAHLQKQVIELQQRLSAVQEKAQAAAATAVAERAQYGRELAKCQQQLASATQRLQGMAGREHQQKITMQKRERYIVKLEQCLLDQNEQLSQQAAAAVAKLSAKAAGPSERKLDNTGIGQPSACSSKLHNNCSMKCRSIEQQYTQQTTQTPQLQAAPDSAAIGSQCAINADVDTASATECDTAKRCPQERSAVGNPAAAAAADINPAAPHALDGDAAQRVAVAQQCKHLMHSGSPQGTASRQRARTASALATERAAKVQGGDQATGGVLEEQPSTLQQLQRSRLQQLQLRPRLSQQQPSIRASPADGPTTTNRLLQASMRMRPAEHDAQEQHLHSNGSLNQQQQRQRRLRELLRQKRLQPKQSQPQANRHLQQQKLRLAEQEMHQTRWLHQNQQCTTTYNPLHAHSLSHGELAGPQECTLVGPDGTRDQIPAVVAANALAEVSQQRTATPTHNGGAPCQPVMQHSGDVVSEEDSLTVATHGFAHHDSPSKLEAVTQRRLSQGNLITKIVEMQQDMQLLKHQLLQLGRS